MLRALSSSTCQNSLSSFSRRGFSLSPVLLHGRQTILSSVIPSELTSGDYLDLSGRHQASIRYRKARCRYHWENPSPGKFSPFPEKTHGFFYYHLPQNAPLFVGGIRFRVCPSNDPRTFQDGHDLFKLNGLPWEISNWALALHKKNYGPWGNALVDAGVIRPGALELCRKLASQVQRREPSKKPIVYSFKQPLPMPLGERKVNFWIADEKNMLRVRLRSRILEPFDVTLTMPRENATAHVCLERDGDDFVVRLLSVPQEYAGKMKYKVGDTIPYIPRRQEVLDIFKNFPEAGHE
ncbi:hypothetical protein D9758_008041 [Tetrapyrgos nigripes]|uniref:Uncharacterized protein n=1 Tax=Tetrapyrgos nigripes TaxID=182062 RepID=A0A8H5D187_9AGAR|nr:hypothetical protein D9758_008041 [Tetrapyrgos nigripes]